jgi:DNA-binding transcriptional LysR family regulator
MDLDRLGYFAAVAETGSVRRAAERLHRSPAAVSKAIKQLERELAVRLLVPAGRGVALSDRGRWLARRARGLLDEAAGLVRELAGPGDAAAVLRLGSFEVFTTWFLETLLPELGDADELVLRELLPGELEVALAAGAVDLAVTLHPVPHPAVESREAGRIEAGVYGRRDVFGRTPLAELPFAVPVQPLAGVPNRIQGLDGWPDGRVPRQVRYRLTLMESALALCRAGRAVAHLPRFVVETMNRRLGPGNRLALLHPTPAEAGPSIVHLLKRRADLDAPFFPLVQRALARVAARPHRRRR